MDTETRFKLIKGVGEEVVTDEELMQLLQAKGHPVAYDGFEPSGVAHLPFGIYRALNIKDLLKAGVHFKLWIADWFGWINNKMGGDLEKIQKVGEYFQEVWKASGIEPAKGKLEFIWAANSMDDEYWKRVIRIAKITSVARATRCLTIMGRKEGEMKEVAQYFYPMMQCSDIFHLKADICQLGLDQRKVNMLAREVGPKLGLWKPVIISHHTLMGLGGLKGEGEGFDKNRKMDIEISSKMSKSKPNTCIYMHDTGEQIRKKINSAYCAPKEADNNPMLDYARHIVFRAFKDMTIERPAKFGGSLTFGTYQELESAFREGKLHPADLKAGIAEHIDKLVKPVRDHFEKNKKAKDLYEFVRKQEITR